MAKNDIFGGEYLEPYAGGGAVGLSLLLKGLVSKIHINDLDTAVYDFWYCVINDTESLLQLINDTEVSIENWHKFKHILDNKAGFSQIERGFATFFLNRTNRSGILKAGVIGGKKQDGMWKLDSRYNKSNLSLRIKKIADKKDSILVYNEDANHLLDRCEDFLPKKYLIYLDPPYYVKGQGLYRNYYSDDDHEDIKNTLSKLNRSWLVSYDNSEEIKEIYRSYRQQRYSLNYSAQVKKRGEEVIIFSNNLSYSAFNA
jgi:DNA adenine methylase